MRVSRLGGVVVAGWMVLPARGIAAPPAEAPTEDVTPSDEPAPEAGAPLEAAAATTTAREPIHAKVEVRKRVAPVYPRAMRGQTEGDVTCTATLAISAEGRPRTVTVDDCPIGFHDAMIDALHK
ncbi:MAG: hypothetical protein KC656_21915, partial [Myxococcales bacterium]|nr:hypothetical protein [Myxococcales bacterium]